MSSTSSPPQGSRRKKLLLALLALALVVTPFAVIALSPRAEFLVGGALVNLGCRLQDPLEDYDFSHHHVIPPAQIWEEALAQNRLASSVRARFPRSTHHPLIAMVVCMDARIDTNELMGDTRKYYYTDPPRGTS